MNQLIDTVDGNAGSLAFETTANIRKAEKPRQRVLFFVDIPSFASSENESLLNDAIELCLNVFSTACSLLKPKATSFGVGVLMEQQAVVQTFPEDRFPDPIDFGCHLRCILRSAGSVTSSNFGPTNEAITKAMGLLGGRDPANPIFGTLVLITSLSDPGNFHRRLKQFLVLPHEAAIGAVNIFAVNVNKTGVKKVLTEVDLKNHPVRCFTIRITPASIDDGVEYILLHGYNFPVGQLTLKLQVRRKGQRRQIKIKFVVPKIPTVGMESVVVDFLCHERSEARTLLQELESGRPFGFQSGQGNIGVIQRASGLHTLTLIRMPVQDLRFLHQGEIAVRETKASYRKRQYSNTE